MPEWVIDARLVTSWLAELDQDSYEQVIAALELLAGRWDVWYRHNVPVADDLFDEHFAQRRQE